MMANGVRFSRFHEQDERKRVSALDKYDCPSGDFVRCAMTVWSVKNSDESCHKAGRKNSPHSIGGWQNRSLST